MIAKIKKNLWGNIYGYHGNKKVIAFADVIECSQEEAANKWLESQKEKGFKIKY